jgi:hypothetical protein
MNNGLLTKESDKLPRLMMGPRQNFSLEKEETNMDGEVVET